MSSRARRNTSSAGIPRTLPSRNSLRRRAASSSQSLSSSDSDGSSRLSRSLLANCARSSMLSTRFPRFGRGFLAALVQSERHNRSPWRLGRTGLRAGHFGRRILPGSNRQRRRSYWESPRHGGSVNPTGYEGGHGECVTVFRKSCT